MKQKTEDSSPLRVLYLEDTKQDVELLREVLFDAHYHLTMDWASSEEAYVSFLRDHSYDVILADFKLPAFDAFGALQRAKEIRSEVPFICVSGSIGEETAVKLLREGAVDYVLKDKLGTLPSSIKRAMDEAKDREARRQTEAALERSEKRLREAQELAHLGFWSWEVGTGKVEWSEEVFTIFGLNPLEFTPQIDSILALSPWPEDHRRDQELIRKATETHKPGSYEQKFLRPDQSIGYYHSTFQGIYDERGNLTSIFGTVLDITERKRAEQETEILARFPAENPSPVLRIDHDGKVLYANPASRPLLRGWGIAVNSQAPELWDTTVKEVLAKGSPKTFDIMIDDRTFSFVAAPIPRAGYVNLYGRDITERKRAEVSLHERAEEFKAINRELERFNNAATGRELRMIELKREVNELCHLSGQSLRYPLDYVNEKPTNPGDDIPTKDGASSHGI